MQADILKHIRGIYSTHKEMHYPSILIQQSPFKGKVHRNRLYILLAEKQRTSTDAVSRENSEENIWMEEGRGDRKLENTA
jgi:hypothetical protein